ncbi:MAG: YbaB/EbfC family nucleoid-associated protein [Alphaproteobacteria bacterium]|nr:YbaB/EbfC family nucleoid-associated protein [Alphaproteobacteria bacterium]
MKNLGNMLKQAQQMQQRMAEMQQRLGDTTAEGSAGAGMVAVTLNGKGDLKRVKIDPKLLDPAEGEVLEDLIVAAFNDAKGKIEALLAQEMQKVTGGMQLPPGFKMPF